VSDVSRIRWRHEDCDATSCVATMELGCEPTILLAALAAPSRTAAQAEPRDDAAYIRSKGRWPENAAAHPDGGVVRETVREANYAAEYARLAAPQKSEASTTASWAEAAKADRHPDGPQGERP
jgi:hypothetical protein